MVRSSIPCCLACLAQSILNDYVSKAHRAKWNSLESINVFSWSGSATLGGFIIDRYDYQTCFLVTAALQLCSATILASLLSLIKVETFAAKPPPAAGGGGDDGALDKATVDELQQQQQQRYEPPQILVVGGLAVDGDDGNGDDDAHHDGSGSNSSSNTSLAGVTFEGGANSRESFAVPDITRAQRGNSVFD